MEVYGRLSFEFPALSFVVLLFPERRDEDRGRRPNVCAVLVAVDFPGVWWYSKADAGLLHSGKKLLVDVDSSSVWKWIDPFPPV